MSSASSSSSSELSLPRICVRLNWMASWWCASLSEGSTDGRRLELASTGLLRTKDVKQNGALTR